MAVPMSFHGDYGCVFRWCWGAISPVLGCDLVGATGGAISLVRSGVGAGVGCDETGLLVRSPCCFSLSLLFSWGVID